MNLPRPRFFRSLDAAQGRGAARLKPAFLQRHLDFIGQQQAPAGGFRGRRGPADPYYTDFALRALVLPGPAGVNLATTAQAVRRWAAEGPADVVACFNLLNTARILEAQGLKIVIDPRTVRRIVARQRRAAGGFTHPDGTTLSAYNSLIGRLCLERLGDPPARPEDAAVLASLQTPEGGYRESPGTAAAEANATAAALMFLALSGALTARRRDAAARFLADLQTPAGGIRAHARAPCADLLSTYNVLAVLTLLEAPVRPHLADLARFVRRLVLPAGGFGACETDTEADVEYAFYGLAALALLHELAARPPPETPQ